jgi:F0F1-type ATP synthase assembly protein I
VGNLSGHHCETVLRVRPAAANALGPRAPCRTPYPPEVIMARGDYLTKAAAETPGTLLPVLSWGCCHPLSVDKFGILCYSVNRHSNLRVDMEDALMSRRGVHEIVGGASGAAFSLASAQATRPSELAVDVIAGSIGGLLGGALPDLLEPPTGPRHRSFFHSVGAAAGLAALLHRILPEPDATAPDQRQHAGITDLLQPTSARTEEALPARLVRALVRGITVGAMSHLLLDAGTPAGLPMVGVCLRPRKERR